MASYGLLAAYTRLFLCIPFPLKPEFFLNCTRLLRIGLITVSRHMEEFCDLHDARGGDLSFGFSTSLVPPPAVEEFLLS